MMDARFTPYEGVVPATNLPMVRFYGVVPADAIRWIAAEEGTDVRSVLPEWLGARSANEYFVVEASGDCLLRSHGIASGNLVLLEWKRADEPDLPNDEVVLIRIGDTFTLKRWFRDGNWIELRDGNDIVVHRMSIMEEFTVVGVYVTHWRPVVLGAKAPMRSS